MDNSSVSQAPTQQLTTSYLNEQDQTKSTRILTRKQIEKRLQALRPAEQDKVIANLTAQNRRLQQDVRELQARVEELMTAKKIPNPHVKNPMMEEEVRRAKKQLALKYESMNYLKEELRKAKQSELTEEMRHKVTENRNQIISLEIEIQQLKNEKVKYEGLCRANLEELDQYNPKSIGRDQKINSYREQNRSLKKKLQSLGSQFKATEKNSQQAIDRLYTLKQEEQKLRVLSDRKKLTLSSLKKVNVTELGTLQKQIQQLKRKKKQTEKQLVNEKFIKDQKRAQLQKQAKENLDQHRQLMKRRLKALNQLNLYEAKDRKSKEVIQSKEKEQKKIDFIDRGAQTERIVPIDFRKDWLGKNGGLQFDDSLNLEYRSHVLIKSVTIYKTNQFISFLKFLYENSQKRKYETKIAADPSSMKKFQIKKYTAKPGTYLVNFKISFTKQIVTKIQLIWSDGQTISQGWQTQGSTKFTADIGTDERPISMFGSYSTNPKTNYALQCLGCQINKVQLQG